MENIYAPLKKLFTHPYPTSLERGMGSISGATNRGNMQLKLQLRRLYEIAGDREATIKSTYLRGQYRPITLAPISRTIRSELLRLHNLIRDTILRELTQNKPLWLW